MHRKGSSGFAGICLILLFLKVSSASSLQLISQACVEESDVLVICHLHDVEAAESTL